MQTLDEQIKELTKTVMELRLDLARMDVKMDSIKDVKDKVDNHASRLTALEASAKSAHLRLDKMESNQTWLWRTLGGAVLLAVVAFVIKGGLVS